MDEKDEAQNMVSNLPLLFANGYPTSLDKITDAQLEKFIPFMVQCSLGHINLQGKLDYSEPEWWPEDIPFKIPLSKPKQFEGSWIEKMKEIVVICYQFHRSIFLLRFCNQLSSYEPARLRFINNYNSTTSLYDRRCNKLLVTFRNENMTYDQTQKNRKCLLLQKSRTHSLDNSTQQRMVEPALFDIYLCDNCDAELYSLEAITEHEKTCVAEDDDDVIICESPTLEINTTSSTDTSKPNDAQREAFLLNFNLQSCTVLSSSGGTKNSISMTHRDKTKDKSFRPLSPNGVNLGSLKSSPVEKLKRLPRRNRGVYALSRCPTIPLSSPAGQLMIKNSKTLMSEDYLYERLDRTERFCHAPVLASSSSSRPKFLDRKLFFPHVSCTFKRPSNYVPRTYMFPKRQFSNRNRMESFLFLNSLLLRRCRPLSVRLRKLSESDLLRQKSFLLSAASYSCSSNNSCFSSNSNNNNTIFNIRLKRESSHSANWKIAHNAKQIVVDTIDLCSSDEEAIIDDDNKSTATSVAPSTGLNFPVNFDRRRIGSEITITPIGRNAVSNTTTPREPSTAIGSEFEEIRKRNKFEGNFLLSQSIANQPKPLQPSVFLFSNYTTETIHFHHFQNDGTSPQRINANGAGLIGGETIVSDSFQNQENFIDSTAKSSRLKPNEDWLSPNRNDRNGKVIHQLMSFMDTDVTLNKITSPNRSISIDLTL